MTRMLFLKNLDPFKEELLIINYKFCFTSPKTVFWESLENYSYLKIYLFLKDKVNLKELKDLQTLYLNNNQLTTVPNFNLPNLRGLYLNNNQLTTVPNFNLPNLQELYLDHNQL